MSNRREKLLVDLAHVVQRHGAAEVLELARAMRDPEVMATLASLLENLASTSHRPRAVQRRKSKQQQIQAVRDTLIESYPTLDSLASLFERLGFGHRNYRSVADAHSAILAQMSTSDDAGRIAREVLGEATRIGGELEQLTKAIVTKRKQ